ncbi:hypothetical protein [Veronia pacifica]|uniref:hypothetical protein n=1 Tax=Veronia pacifica TaxID=1080227 RepID=UPI001585D50B|nr:hypothetical protein [Veronia pacifica]
MELTDKEGDLAYLDGYLTLKEMLDIGMLVMVSDAQDQNVKSKEASEREQADKD